MNKLKLLAWLFVIFNLPTVHAEMDHSAHGGSSGGKSAGTGTACEKPHLSKFLPLNLALVAPGSEISFRAVNIQDPKQIAVTVKNIPVEIISEFKDPFYSIKTKLPDSLRNTVARINIKVAGKTSHCEAENGWLVKISE
jgi:hypothetical protein